MPARRSRTTTAVVLATLLLGGALAGCDKPAPGATVVSGSTSAYREALCWSFDGSPYDDQDCSVDTSTATSKADVLRTLDDYVATIPVNAGEPVGISVDNAVADAGWRVTINSRPLHRGLITDTYFRFVVPPQALRNDDSAELQIQAASDEPGKARGFWVFRLQSTTLG
jgi:hypothetical protein